MIIEKDDIFYGYHAGDGLNEWTLCKYTPLEIDNKNSRYLFLNEKTLKHHSFYPEKIEDELSKNPLDAAIKFSQFINSRIEELTININTLKKISARALEEARLLVSVKNN